MTDCCCANGGRRGPHAAAPPVELATRNAGQPTRAWALHTHLFSKVSGQGRAGQGRAVESTAELQGSAGQSTAGQRSKTERSSVEQARTCSARGRRSRGRCQWRCCSLPAPAAACPGGSARCRGCLREGGREVAGATAALWKAGSPVGQQGSGVRVHAPQNIAWLQAAPVHLPRFRSSGSSGSSTHPASPQARPTSGALLSKCTHLMQPDCEQRLCLDPPRLTPGSAHEVGDPV